MKRNKTGNGITRSRAAEMLDKTPRTLRRYEVQGLLTPIKLNCRVVIYREEEVQRILNGNVQTAADRTTEAVLPRTAGGTFAPRQEKEISQ